MQTYRNIEVVLNLMQDLKQLDVENNSHEISEALARISSGRALLFTGAGFSVGTTNILGEEPPRAKQLAHKIAELAGIEEDDDLKYVSDYFLENNNPERLINLLLEMAKLYSSKNYVPIYFY